MLHLQPGDPLPAEIVDLVAAMVEPLGDEAGDLIRQAREATVKSASPTMLSVDPADASPGELPWHPVLPTRGLVKGDGGEILSEIMVWVQDGRFTGIEQPWYTDTPPSDWPPLDRLDVCLHDGSAM